MTNLGQPMKDVANAFDTTRRFVRVTGERDDFVEFDFAVGEPDVFVELILGGAAFAEFCEANKVEKLAPRVVGEAGQSDWDWRLADARHNRFK